MDWSECAHVIVSALSFTTLLFFSQNEQNHLKEQQSMIQSIVTAIMNSDFVTADYLWKETVLLEFEDDNLYGRPSSLLNQMRFSEILRVAYFENSTGLDYNNLQNKSTLSLPVSSSPSTSIKLAKFIHFSIEYSNKHLYYAALYEAMKSNNKVYKDSSVFVLGRFILADNVQAVPIRVSSSKHVNLLLDIIPLPVWACLLQRNFILRNVKYRSYMYVGSTGGNGRKEMLAWNRDKLLNTGQATFGIHPHKDFMTDDQVKFIWLYPSLNMSIGLKITNNSEGYTNNYDLVFNNVDEDGSLWSVELVDDTTIRLISHQNGFGGFNNKGFVYVKGPEYDIDPSRSRVAVTSDYGSENNYGTEMEWRLSFVRS